MKNKTTLLSTLLCLSPIVLAALLYNQLPSQIAVHFDAAGNPDLYFPKPIGAFGLPVILALINLYAHFRTFSDPKPEQTPSAMRTFGLWIAPLLSIILVPITLFLAMGQSIPIVMIVTAIAGVVVLVCGNYLPKCKPNTNVGLKLPWTLHDTQNWNYTHRVCGFLWVLGGIALVINAFFQLPYITIGLLVFLILFPICVSYFYYCSHTSAK